MAELNMAERKQEARLKFLKTVYEKGNARKTAIVYIRDVGEDIGVSTAEAQDIASYLMGEQLIEGKVLGWWHCYHQLWH